MEWSVRCPPTRLFSAVQPAVSIAPRLRIIRPPRVRNKHKNQQLNAFVTPLEGFVQKTLTMISLSDLFFYACGLYAVKTLISFITSNCDLRLLSKADPPQGAFQGKVVWIVGASQGLGKGLALEWATRGAKLILSSRNKERLLHVKEECSQVAPSANSISIVPFDITDTHDRIQSVVQSAFSEFGSIDYIVYNAGASQHAPVEETSDEVAKKLIEMNLIGQISLARACLGHFLKQGYGHHVVIASMAATVPSPGQAVYAAAKSGLKSYFLSLSSELDSKGISVSIICPGPVDAGDQTQPRRVYGRDGMMEQKNSSKSSKRIEISVFAKLALRAVYHKLDECWITKNPILIMGYLMQLMPGIAMALLKKVGPGRVRQLDKGSGTGYEVVDMLKKQ
jgi:dehydrogenase/reductase SDR family protein 7